MWSFKLAPQSTGMPVIGTVSYTTIGTVVLGTRYTNDFSIITASGWTSNNVVGGGYSVTGVSSPVVGETVFRYENVSQIGQAKITKIDASYVDYLEYDAVTVSGVVEASVVSKTSQKGDSGGAYFVLKYGIYNFLGVHSGGVNNNVYFTSSSIMCSKYIDGKYFTIKTQ